MAEATGPNSAAFLLPLGAFAEDIDNPVKLDRSIEPGEVMTTMRQQGDLGNHLQAAELGSRWTSTHAAVRPRILIRLHAAIHYVHCGQHGHALALLHGIESAVQEPAIPGDYVQPAVVAWTALASYFTGDHTRTDSELSRFAALDSPPLIVEASFRPAVLIASAYRCLDRLDVKAAVPLLTKLKSFPDTGDLWIHVPVIERRLALLTADSESHLLLADENVEVYSRGQLSTEIGNHILNVSHATALIVQGQWREADMLLDHIPHTWGIKRVLQGLSALLAGHPDETISVAESHKFHIHLDTRERAMLTGLKSVAYLHTDHLQQAHTAFKEALELSVWTGSLLPIFFLPAAERKLLLQAVNDATVWNRLLAEFHAPGDNVDSFRHKLEDAATTIVAKKRQLKLNARESSLLQLLNQGKSIPEIADELDFVDGTVKNKLSALYRKLGVRNRASAVEKSRTLGLRGG